MSDLTHEDCLEHGFSPCEGQVKFHDRYSTRGLPVELAYKKFPRCDAHYAAYLRDCAAREKASGRRW